MDKATHWTKRLIHEYETYITTLKLGSQSSSPFHSYHRKVFSYCPATLSCKLWESTLVTSQSFSVTMTCSSYVHHESTHLTGGLVAHWTGEGDGELMTNPAFKLIKFVNVEEVETYHVQHNTTNLSKTTADWLLSNWHALEKSKAFNSPTNFYRPLAGISYYGIITVILSQ
jgi:hypothetical protein